MPDPLVAKLLKFLPISVREEVDSTTGEPIYANVTFGEHETQAMTMQPDDWLALNGIPDRIEQLQAQNAKLNALIEQMQQVVRDYLPPDSGITPVGTLCHLIALLDGPEQREAQGMSNE